MAMHRALTSSPIARVVVTFTVDLPHTDPVVVLPDTRRPLHLLRLALRAPSSAFSA
jgi:hypothetical protein